MAANDTDNLNRLRDAFANMPHTDHPAIWQALYSESFTPWDRAGPSLALADLLAQRTDLIPASQERDSRGNPLRDARGRVIRRSALVPGCGPGHDVLLLSSLGYDAVGLDFSDLAIKKAIDNERAAAQAAAKASSHAAAAAAAADDDDNKDDDNHDDDHDSHSNANKNKHSKNSVDVDEDVDRGSVTWLKGDFFSDDWRTDDAAAAQSPPPRKYDLIFDYTFLCALQPPLRPRWAQRMAQLLAPGGHLICLEFPTGKPLSQQGPPWGLWPEVYEALLAAPGQDVLYNDDGTLASDPCPDAPHPDALHRICLVKPPRTHKAGTNEDGSVRDFISVWCR